MSNPDDLKVRIPALSREERSFLITDMKRAGVPDHGSYFLHLLRQARAAEKS